MKNFIAHGEVIEVTATAAITSGEAVVIGDTVGVAIISGAIGDKVSCAQEGVYELPKAAGAIIAQGKKCYFVVADKNITGTAGSNIFAGYAYEGAAAADATVKVKLAQ